MRGRERGGGGGEGGSDREDLCRDLRSNWVTGLFYSFLFLLFQRQMLFKGERKRNRARASGM